MFMRLVCFVALCLSATHAQNLRPEAYLRKNAVRLSGVVTDPGGRPLPDVSIDHSGIEGSTPKTDAQGRFEIATRAPAIVFRKIGFNGKYFRVERKDTIEITLGPVASLLPSCSSTSGCESLNTSSSNFCLAKVSGVNVSPVSTDIDYVVRYFWIEMPKDDIWIMHGEGMTWSFGLPSNEDVWSSVEYEEKAYLYGEGFPVLDARGVHPNGGRWRFFGHMSETASYDRASVDEARVLDKVLDGVCLRPRR